jgi:uncharacterized protein YegL
MIRKTTVISLAGLLVLASQYTEALVFAGDHVVVVLDDSGSMGDRMQRQTRVSKMSAAKTALISVLESLPTDAKVGIVRLNSSPAWVVPLGPVEPESTRSAITDIAAQGGTPLGKCMKIGADALLEARQAEHYGNYRLLIVTDGEATDARLVERYLPDILSRGLIVDVIGVDMSEQHSLATQVHSYRRADDPKMLATAVREVFAETSATATDAGESDFELLAAIPDECATAALVALAESGNQPIGQSPRPTTSSGGRDSNTSGPLSRRTPPGQPGEDSPVSFMGILVVLVVFTLIVRTIFGGRRAKRR